MSPCARGEARADGGVPRAYLEEKGGLVDGAELFVGEARTLVRVRETGEDPKEGGVRACSPQSVIARNVLRFVGGRFSCHHATHLYRLGVSPHGVAREHTDLVFELFRDLLQFKSQRALRGGDDVPCSGPPH